MSERPYKIVPETSESFDMLKLDENDPESKKRDEPVYISAKDDIGIGFDSNIDKEDPNQQTLPQSIKANENIMNTNF